MGTRQCRATPKFRGLIVAVAAIAEKAEKQHNERENRDKYHEQPNREDNGVKRVARVTKQSLPCDVASKNRRITADNILFIFERWRACDVTESCGSAVRDLGAKLKAGSEPHPLSATDLFFP